MIKKRMMRNNNVSITVRISKTVRVTFLIFLVNFFVGSALKAQFNTPFENVIPASPDASSLGKYGEMPINLHNGAVSVDIPLGNMLLGDMQLPISLSYHTSGIRVGDVASRVGLGWSLNAGGVITRSIRGVDDLLGKGIYVENYYENHNNHYELGMEIYSGNKDGEPDIFSFNVGGYSGRFVLTHDHQVRLLEYQNIVIKTPQETGVGWEIITPDGLIYKFTDVERTNTYPSSGGGVLNVSTSWFLSEIEHPNRIDRMYFNYEDETTMDRAVFSETLYQSIFSFGTNQYTELDTENNTRFQILSKRLSTVDFPNGSIELVSEDYRKDLQGSKVYNKILFKDEFDNVTKSFKLKYKYFNGSALVDFSAGSETNVSNPNLRLVLAEVIQIDNSGIELNKYTLEYEDQVWLPNRLESRAVDHWGYYNGEDSNTLLIPGFNGVNRSAVWPFVKAGSLKKITYPTGGSTNFGYEINKSSDHGLPNQIETVVSKVIIGSCNLLKPNSFTIDDVVDSEAPVVIELTGGPWIFDEDSPVTSCGTVTKQVRVGDIDSQIFFKIFELNDLVNPVYTSGEEHTLGAQLEAPDHTSITLPNGTYVIKPYTRCETNCREAVASDMVLYGSYTFSVKALVEREYVSSGEINVGGLRIQSVINKDEFGEISSQKNYSYTLENSSESSGYVSYIPAYWYDRMRRTETGDIAVVEYSSQGMHSASQIGSSHIGYKRVVESSPGNGSTENYYSHEPTFYPQSKRIIYLDGDFSGDIRLSYPVNVFPFASGMFASWKRSQLQRQVFKNSNGEVVKELNYFYDNTSFTNEDDYLYGIKLINRGPDAANPIFSFQIYRIFEGAGKLTQSIEYLYENGERKETKNINYQYENSEHLLVTKETSSLSNGKVLLTQYLYPEDFSNSNDGTFISAMKEANIVEKPVETVNLIMDTNEENVRVLSGQLITYHQGSNVGRPHQIRTVELESSLPLENFKFSNQLVTGYIPSGQEGGFQIENIDNSYSKVIVEFDFDNSGNIREKQNRDGSYTSFIWGYEDSYPVAKIEGASYSSISGYVSNIKSKSNLDDDTCRGTSGCDEANLRAALNALRNGVSGAMVTTYTYDPLVGMTSQTDSNGRTTYYEYDDFGRLERVIDDEGNPVSAYEYNYKNQ
ncbi:RHS repeat domain-containing protein [Reichenbachiella ulvae]|uniref:RHS repeat protein n=1 Tax=Reichenbachiella ulvae TaxID=2980104 RepID=A0ABT3CV05_9BACT|nr:RHS repeat domain-containing protein [Reichenbachiella ulvae]MCV9387467.1 RHS repeat protein [Reichenbachiella ulvae]